MPALNKTKIPKEQEQEICDLRKSGMSYTQLSYKYKCSVSNISNICDRNGYGTGIKKSKIRCNENYFENIDTPDKAYFLGFLIGDGHISKNKRY